MATTRWVWCSIVVAVLGCGDDDGDDDVAAIIDASARDAAVVVDAASGVPDAAPLPDATETAFEFDFETDLPDAVKPELALLTPSQGYEPLGPEGNTFGPTFLRAPTSNTLTVCLEDLPPHTSVTLDFLFAAIDSLDGTGEPPAGDFFAVTVDDVMVFRESFANATPDQIQSYVPPPGVELARRVDLGFEGPGSFFTDSAYYLGADPIFHDIPHTADTLVVTFTLEGPGVQPLNDESWAIDNLKIRLGYD